MALGLGLTVGPRLAAYHGNPTGLIQFGRQFARDTHPPPGAIIGSPIGYDGQFIWIHARDPLVLHQSTLADLAVGLTPGLVMGTLRDLSDPLATTAMLGGLIAYERGRRWPAATLLTLGVLAREPMIVAVVAVGVDMLAGLWRARSAPDSRRRVAHAWPAVILPMVIFAGWQLYTKSLTLPAAPSTPAPHARAAPTTRAPAGSDTLVLPPFSDFRTEIRRTTTIDTAPSAVWDLVYIALVLAGMVAAVAALRRGPWASTVTAVLTSAVLTVIFFGDEWGISRYGAPLFGALLLSGLRAGVRAPPRLCAAAAVLTLFIRWSCPAGDPA